MSGFYRIHPEHDASLTASQVVRLCEHHLRQAEDCLMVIDRDVPEVESVCFCPTCHFCD